MIINIVITIDDTERRSDNFKIKLLTEQLSAKQKV